MQEGTAGSDNVRFFSVVLQCVKNTQDIYSLFVCTEHNTIIHLPEQGFPVSAKEQILIFAFRKLAGILLQAVIDRFKLIQEVGCGVGTFQIMNQICNQLLRGWFYDCRLSQQAGFSVPVPPSR